MKKKKQGKRAGYFVNTDADRQQAASITLQTMAECE